MCKFIHGSLFTPFTQSLLVGEMKKFNLSELAGTTEHISFGTWTRGMDLAHHLSIL